MTVTAFTGMTALAFPGMTAPALPGMTAPAFPGMTVPDSLRQGPVQDLKPALRDIAATR